MTHSVRRPLAAAAVLSLAVVLTACGSSDSAGSAAPSVSPSPSASSSASSSASASASATPSSTATTETSEPTPAASGPTPVSAADLATLVDGALDDTSAAHLVVENGLGFLSGEGDVDFRQTPSSLAMTLTSDETGDSAQAIAVQVIGPTLYIQDGQGFLKVDIDSKSNPFGSSFSDQLDPRTVMDAVEQHLIGATARGTVQSGGDTLDVYRATAQGPALLQQLAPELASQDDVVVPDTVRCDLTVGSDGHARSITVDLGQENGQLVYTLTDWRTDVSIVAPPAAQVSDLPDLG